MGGVATASERDTLSSYLTMVISKEILFRFSSTSGSRPARWQSQLIDGLQDRSVADDQTLEPALSRKVHKQDADQDRQRVPARKYQYEDPDLNQDVSERVLPDNQYPLYCRVMISPHPPLFCSACEVVFRNVDYQQRYHDQAYRKSND